MRGCGSEVHSIPTAQSRDRTAARHAIDFFGHLRHSTGEWAGEPFVLQGWQQFVEQVEEALGNGVVVTV
ncbi:hypothetical protein VB636_18465, partial [Paracoccus sp. APAP_BH8]|uniref:hypothetical protein n=1 Tax=Paracoccus sp. APAP_BH8 TaxID=3110237 RepID=UPI002FD8559E